MSSTKTIAFFGASGGCGYSALKHALTAGYTCIALCRKPSKLTDRFPSDKHPNLTVIQGNAHDASAVAKCLVNPANPSRTVDKILVSIGGLFQFSKMSIDDPHVCEHGADTLLAALSSIRARGVSGRPQIIAISSLGVSKFGRDIPLAYIPLYNYILKVPHEDKKLMEEKIRNSGEPYSLVRPSLLATDETDRPVRVGIEDPKRGTEVAVSGYRISKEDVGRWIYENYFRDERPEYAQKAVSITH